MEKPMTSSRRRLAATLVGLAFAATACGSAEGDSAPAAPSESVSVEHAMGTTEVPCTPEKVVTLGQGQTDSVLGLGVTPVGVVEPWTDDWYEYLPAEVEEAEVLGTELEPDLEKIAALQPDVILGSKLRHEALYPQLSEIAPTVFSETIGVTWKENVSLWAQALCLPEKGEEVVADYEARAAAIGDALAEQGKADTEVSMIRFMPDQVRIYLTGFPGSVLRDAGLQRPEAQQVEDWAESPQLIEISEERIPEMDGDVIFQMVSSEHYAQQGTQTVDEQMERWTSTDLWKNLSAVKSGDVVVVDESHWNLGGGILSANAMLDDLEDHFLDGK
jgi:iron complex transport system substrate-binding protein